MNKRFGNIPAASSFYLETPEYHNAPKLTDIIDIITKNNYSAMVKKKRMELVHSHFSKELSELFKKLNDDAERMKPCHRQVSFWIPEPLDKNKMEKILKDYFTDLGYKPIKEDVEGEDKDDYIMITLT